MNTQPDPKTLPGRSSYNAHRVGSVTLLTVPDNSLVQHGLSQDTVRRLRDELDACLDDKRLTAQPEPVAPESLSMHMVQQLSALLAAAGAPEFDDANHAAEWAASVKLAMENKAQPAPVSWIKTSERLPDQTTPVYFVMRGNVMHGMFGDCLFHGEIGAFNPREVSHWQPWTLPAQPAPVTEAEAYRRLDALGVKLNAVKSHAHDIVSLVSEVTADASKLAALNRATQPAASWVKTSERLPQNAACVYALLNGAILPCLFLRGHNEDNSCFQEGSGMQFRISEVTHWQPWTLPELPSEECQRGAGEPASDLPNWVGTKQVSGPESDSFVMREAVPTPQPSEVCERTLEAITADMMNHARGGHDIGRHCYQAAQHLRRIPVLEQERDAALARAEKAERELAKLAELLALEKMSLEPLLNDRAVAREQLAKMTVWKDALADRLAALTPTPNAGGQARE